MQESVERTLMRAVSCSASWASCFRSTSTTAAIPGGVGARVPHCMWEQMISYETTLHSLSSHQASWFSYSHGSRLPCTFQYPSSDERRIEDWTVGDFTSLLKSSRRRAKHQPEHNSLGGERVAEDRSDTSFIARFVANMMSEFACDSASLSL